MSEIHLLPIPTSTRELRALPIHVKPDWRGVVARVVGAFFWVCERLARVYAISAGALIGALALATAGVSVAPWMWIPFAVLALAALIANGLGLGRWATSVLDDWVQVIDGRVYLQRGRNVVANPPSMSLLGHESVHDWQARKFGKVTYTLNYTLRRKMRRHYEAMAYGYQVAEWARDPESAAISAAKPVYGMGWTRAEARELIDAYADAFTTLWRLHE